MIFFLEIYLIHRSIHREQISLFDDSRMYRRVARIVKGEENIIRVYSVRDII